jgi:large subunit ribosomal protein L25
MTKIKLEYKKRNVFGKKVKNLRKEGLVPANIFGKKIKSESITVDLKEFKSAFEKAGETQIIDLSGKPVLISNVQLDPVEGTPIHVDFRKVDLTEKIKASVPVVADGESPAEKQGLGVVVLQLHEVEVEALPADLPEKIEIDQEVLTDVDQAIYVKDLKVSKGVEVLNDPEAIVIKVEPPQKEEEPEPVPEPTEGPESESQTEGEKPAESGEAKAENNLDQSA